MCITFGTILLFVFGFAWSLQSQEIAQKRRQNEAEDHAFLRHQLRLLNDPRYVGEDAPPHPYYDQIMQSIARTPLRTTAEGARVFVRLIEKGYSIERAIKQTRQYR